MSTKEPHILGIDPGTNITGYCILDFNGNLLDYGTIRPVGKLPKKLLIVHNALEELLQKFNITEMGIETQFVGKNPRAAITLGMARGIALMLAQRYNIHAFEYAPSKIKVAICKNGRAKKHVIQKMCELIYRLQNVPEDAADAIAVARCHLHSRPEKISSA
ncbi:MAG: Crossover junction endodeoxyribonuclease RuvC [Chlamydiae bacterium]|nr:Crossover junction endodeoxyribonuclease RuvC [Chlamydiota bacterium]